MVEKQNSSQLLLHFEYLLINKINFLSKSAQDSLSRYSLLSFISFAIIFFGFGTDSLAYRILDKLKLVNISYHGFDVLDILLFTLPVIPSIYAIIYLLRVRKIQKNNKLNNLKLPIVQDEVLCNYIIMLLVKEKKINIEKVEDIREFFNKHKMVTIFIAKYDFHRFLNSYLEENFSDIDLELNRYLLEVILLRSENNSVIKESEKKLDDITFYIDIDLEKFLSFQIGAL